MARKTKLTDKQEKLVDGILDGKSVRQASAVAGYTNQASGYQATRVAEVQQRLKEGREQLADATMIKRVDIIEGILEAVEIARLAADPGSMIRGYSEVAKMLGYYEPEKKIIELTTEQGRLRQKFETMTDDELLMLMDQPDPNAIDGEFRAIQ